MKINALVATLGMGSPLGGAALWYTNGAVFYWRGLIRAVVAGRYLQGADG